MWKMLNINTLVERIKILAEKYRIIYAIVFGSLIEKRFIKGESDIDLAIKVANLKENEVYDFLKNFMRDLNINNLDIIIINFSPFSLKYDILTRGKIIFCRNEEELFEDELKIRKLYNDWIYFSKNFEEREIKKVMK
ncbi:MAG: nucleotidyltransferase domain-containing protein [Nitrososphaerota archaeon]